MYLFHNIYVSICFYTGFLFLAGLRELYAHKCNGKRRRLYLNASQKSINTGIDGILVILGIIQLILYGNHVDNSNLYLKNTKLEHWEFIVQFVIDCIFRRSPETFEAISARTVKVVRTLGFEFSIIKPFLSSILLQENNKKAKKIRIKK